MLSLSYDLHIHSCLSPCADNESTPANIVGMGYVKGLDVIAISDHNSSKNCVAAKKVADAYNKTLVCGMEITSSEEVHVLSLLPSLDKALELDEYVNKRIVEIKNNPKIFGDQLIMDEDDNIIATEDKLLINATTISFLDVFDIVESLGGVAIPAHIDKQTNSLLSNLGMIPVESKFKTVEVKNIDNFEGLKTVHSYLNNCKAITNSDAHYLKDINEPINFLHAEENSAEAIIYALKNPILL